MVHIVRSEKKSKPGISSTPQFLYGFICAVLLSRVCGCGPAETDAVPSAATSATVAANKATEAAINHGLRLTETAEVFGVRFRDEPKNPASYEDSMILGAGCAIHDLDRDGLADILLLRMRLRDSGNAKSPCGITVFRQVSPGQFVDVTVETGLSECKGGSGVAVGDCSNDGWPDLLVTSPFDVQLWLNLGAGKFRNVTQEAGLDHSGWAVSASWLDFDRDGWLDLFVANYLEHTNQPCTSLSGGKRDFCSPLLFNPTTDRLYRNTTGDAAAPTALNESAVRFVDVTAHSGISDVTSAGMGTLAVDVTDDGWPDVYVASDQRPNRLWVNQRNGTFLEQAGLLGCDADFQGRMQASMGLAFGTLDNHAQESLLVSNLSGEFHSVYTATPHGFVDRSRETGIGLQTRPFTGFGIALTDLDCDGSSELLTANGRVARPDGVEQNSDDFWAPYREPIQLLQSHAGRYQQIDWSDAQDLHVARGLAIGDLDADGDQDVLVSTIGEPAIILRNDSIRAGNWVGLRFTDEVMGGRSCPGTVCLIRTNEGVIRRTLQPCQSYASTHEDLLHVGLRPLQQIEFIDVFWPHTDNSPERFLINAENGSSALNCVHTLTRNQGQSIKLDR